MAHVHAQTHIHTAELCQPKKYQQSSETKQDIKNPDFIVVPWRRALTQGKSVYPEKPTTDAEHSRCSVLPQMGHTHCCHIPGDPTLNPAMLCLRWQTSRDQHSTLQSSKLINMIPKPLLLMVYVTQISSLVKDFLCFKYLLWNTEQCIF